MNPVKVGLIGFGRMGGFYLDEMQKSGRWDVAYICDVCAESRDLARKLAPGAKVVDDEQVIKGEQKFYEAKCHLCHVTTLHTKPRGSSLLMGTQLPWLGSQTIHPYSDFLLHDMGSEIMGVGLNDNYVSGLARGNEWRTTPLWGIGLQEIVNGHTYFLHDGRARNLVEAIMWHGGEAEASKNLFKNMSKEDRDALVAFINSL